MVPQMEASERHDKQLHGTHRSEEVKGGPYMVKELRGHCRLNLSAVNVVQHKQQRLSLTLHLKFLHARRSVTNACTGYMTA